ncbi:TPA: maltose ABC transporter substrate-binding protein, partial [Klebsiella pneumoniae]|nr:maltose ABC transporter substrate-binding protein [Klebsiella pneumoniae]
MSAEISPEKDAKLLIWSDESAIAYIKYAGDKFNEKYHSNISFTVRGLAPIDSASRIIQDGGSTRVADVAEIEHDQLGRLVVAGGVMENLVSGNRIKNTFLQNAVDASYYDGHNYGFPVSYATMALFYNKDILPDAPKSFEQLINFSKKFNIPKENRYALLWDVQNYYESRMFVAMYGAYEFGHNGTDVRDIGINSIKAQKGLESMKQLKAANSANPADLRNPQVRRGLFSEGKIAAIIDGPWAVQGYENSKINYGVIPIPTLNGEKPRTFSTVRLAIVTSYSPYPKAAQLFADFLTTNEMLLKRYEMTNSLPPVPELMKKISESANDATKSFIAQGNNSDAMPAIPEMG